jgi:hypothetical protein
MNNIGKEKIASEVSTVLNWRRAISVCGQL